jgi:hypothetical protein
VLAWPYLLECSAHHWEALVMSHTLKAVIGNPPRGNYGRPVRLWRGLGSARGAPFSGFGVHRAGAGGEAG